MTNNKDDHPEENKSNADDSADNFGLPDLDYKPLNREEQPEETVRHETILEPENTGYENDSTSSESGADEVYDEEESRSNAPVIIGIIIAVVVLAGGFLAFKYVYLPKKEKEKQELAEKAALEKKKVQEDSLARIRADEDKRRIDAEAAAKAKPAEGTIEILSGRTQRYYVVVTSDIDDDLVMDLAKKLSTQGVSSRIIPPFGKAKYYRLTIADFDTYEAAQASADALKASHGGGLWVIKY